jgi:hypothetical protein
MFVEFILDAAEAGFLFSDVDDDVSYLNKHIKPNAIRKLLNEWT